MQVVSREIAIVDQALRRHPHAGSYRLSHTSDRLVIYERAGLNVADMLAAFGPHVAAALGPDMEKPSGTLRAAGFAPVLRFVLQDQEQRTFQAERIRSPDSQDDWTGVGQPGPLRGLVSQTVPLLGTAEFFTLK